MSGGFSLREAMLSLEKRGDQTEVILHPNIIIVPYVQSTILVNDQYKYVKITYKKKNQSSVIKKTTTLLIIFGHALKYFVSQEKLNFVSSLRKGAGAMVYIDIMQVVVKKMDSRRNFPRSDFHQIVIVETACRIFTPRKV